MHFSWLSRVCVVAAASDAEHHLADPQANYESCIRVVGPIVVNLAKFIAGIIVGGGQAES